MDAEQLGTGNSGQGGVTVAVVARTVPSRRPSGRGRYPRVNRDKWTQMLEAWRERQTIVHVMRKADVGERLAKRAIYKGWPELGFAPLYEIGRSQDRVYEAMAASRVRNDLSEVAQDEGARQAAEEALACREALRNTIKAGEVFGKVLDKIHRGFETGRVMLKGLSINKDGEVEGEIDQNTLMSLCRGAQNLTAAVQKIMEAERMRTGNPEEAVGSQIGVLIDKCSPEEIRVIATTGKIPGRLLTLGSTPASSSVFEEGEGLEGFEDAGDQEDPMKVAALRQE